MFRLDTNEVPSACPVQPMAMAPWPFFWLLLLSSLAPQLLCGDRQRRSPVWLDLASSEGRRMVD